MKRIHSPIRKRSTNQNDKRATIPYTAGCRMPDSGVVNIQSCFFCSHSLNIGMPYAAAPFYLDILHFDGILHSSSDIEVYYLILHRTLIYFVTLLFAAIPLHSQERKDTSLTLYFSSAEYMPDSSQTQELVNFLSHVDGITTIIGYADTVGTISYNRNLSRLRALSVYQIISKQQTVDVSYSFKGEEFQQ